MFSLNMPSDTWITRVKHISVSSSTRFSHVKEFWNGFVILHVETLGNHKGGQFDTVECSVDIFVMPQLANVYIFGNCQWHMDGAQLSLLLNRLRLGKTQQQFLIVYHRLTIHLVFLVKNLMSDKGLCKWSEEHAKTLPKNVSWTFSFFPRDACICIAIRETSFCTIHGYWVRLWNKLCVHCGHVPYARYVPFLLAREGKISRDIARHLAKHYIPNDWCLCDKKDPEAPTSLNDFAFRFTKRKIIIYDEDEDAFGHLTLEEALANINVFEN